MREITGNLWDFYDVWNLVIPTNVGWRKDGVNVMGRGVAQQAATKFPELAAWYGGQCQQMAKEAERLLQRPSNHVRNEDTQALLLSDHSESGPPIALGSQDDYQSLSHSYDEQTLPAKEDGLEVSESPSDAQEQRRRQNLERNNNLDQSNIDLSEGVSNETQQFASENNPDRNADTHDSSARGQAPHKRGTAREKDGLADRSSLDIIRRIGIIQLRFWRGLILFPVKPLNLAEPWLSWRSQAVLAVVENSVKQLAAAELSTPVALPLVGCGNGRLREEDVLPILHEHLDDRFTLVRYDVSR